MTNTLHILSFRYWTEIVEIYVPVHQYTVSPGELEGWIEGVELSIQYYCPTNTCAQLRGDPCSSVVIDKHVHPCIPENSLMACNEFPFLEIRPANIYTKQHSFVLILPQSSRAHISGRKTTTYQHMRS